MSFSLHPLLQCVRQFMIIGVLPLPIYSTLRRKLVRNARKDVEQYLAKKSWVTTDCTLMSDIWTYVLT